MRRRFALAVLTIVLQIAGFGTIAHAQSKLPCEAFARLGDGSWQALTTILIPDRQFKVQEGSLWRPGATVMGLDLATVLDKQCPNAPVGLPQGAAAPAPSGVPAAPGAPQQPPAALLERYSDANGNIDARQLTCGQLDDTSADESTLLLGWYSGWYAGSAKKRDVNLPRVRYAIRSVLDYCRANRDKALLDVMQLMLK